MVDVKISFSHKHNGSSFYNVYANHKQVGILTDMLSSGYRFEANRYLPISRGVHTFNSLTDAIEKLPNLLVHWIAEELLCLN